VFVVQRVEHARPARELDITAARPESVLSGRVLAEIARDGKRT